MSLRKPAPSPHKPAPSPHKPAPSPHRPARIVVLAAGQGSNLQAIFDAIDTGTLEAEVVLVVSHRLDAYALERAATRGVRTAVQTLAAVKAQGGTRDDFDRWLAASVAAAKPDLIVCAGWMLILGAPFLQPWGARTVNLHPALPGAFAGKDGIGDAWRAAQEHYARGGGETGTGVMVHEVVAELDAGTPVAVEHVGIRRGESLESLTERMHAAEHLVLVRAIRLKLAQLPQAAS
jgi:phosphoribosylglycinamide formyltransferase